MCCKRSATCPALPPVKRRKNAIVKRASCPGDGLRDAFSWDPPRSTHELSLGRSVRQIYWRTRVCTGLSGLAVRVTKVLAYCDDDSDTSCTMFVDIEGDVASI